MKKNPLNELNTLGQSIWLDYIKRDLMESGKLKKLINDDNLRGMTSNPSLFEKVIAESNDYDNDIETMSSAGKDTSQIYEALTQKDVQDAADVFRDLYNKSNGGDGYVSLEVNPHLAHNTKGTIDEARRFWTMLDRPNVLIKVPATKEGLPAIKQLISEGINVNVTLLFGLPRYSEVAEAYISGLEARAAAEKPINHIASVASFFLSRIDSMIDPILIRNTSKQTAISKNARELQGEVAIASAKKAYQIYKALFTSDRFKKLIEKGAKTQRLLWASTSTKNPAYADIKYIEALIGPETINTIPLETFEAYLDHGNPKVRLNSELGQIPKVFQSLVEQGIDIDQVTQQLEKEGVDKFIKSFDQLLATLKDKVSNKGS